MTARNSLILTYDASINRTFSTNSSTPFTFTGDLVIDYGDNTTETINTNKQLSHTYADNNTYTITITGNITGIGTHCLFNCAGLTGVIIPNSITYMGTGCFEADDNLVSAVIPSSVASMSYYWFYSCDALIDYQLYWEVPPGEYDSDTMRTNTDTIFTIPYGTTQTYVNAGYPLAKLSERDPVYTTVNDAVNDNPNAIVLEYDASIALSFENDLSNPFTYTGSIEIDWGDGTKETYSGGLLSHTYASEKTFIIVINGNITQIKDGQPNGFVVSGGFNKIEGIISAVLPANLTYIGDLAFRNCINLNDIKISPNTTYIGIAAFTSTNINSIIIPEQVTSISINSFRDCFNLQKISIPNSITTLENQCFDGCPVLEYQLYWRTNDTIIQYHSYTMPTQNNTIFYIPKGTMDLYIAAGYPINKLVERIEKNETLNGALEILGERMADNLVSMGVSADASEGLIPLANKILTIQKTNGVLLSTALSLDANLHQIPSFENTTLTATLYASYDDESVYDNDLAGIIQGAEISFYNNDNLIGTAVTDVNGVATLTEYNIEPGTYVYTAEYDGTADYENAESDPVSITCYNDYEMTVQDRYIGEVGDTIDVDIRITNNNIPVANATVSMTGSDGSEYSVDTNANGVAVFELDDLDGSGVYEYEIAYGSLSAECEIINAFIYDKGLENDHTTYWSNNANITITRDNEGALFTNSTENHQGMNLDYITDPSTVYDYSAPFAYEFDCISCSDNNALVMINSQSLDGNKNFGMLNIQDGDHIKITVDENYIRYYNNNEEITERKVQNTSTTPFRIGLRVAPNSSLKYKNFYVYSLPYEPVYELSFDSDTIYGEVGDSIPVTVNLKDQYGRGIPGKSVKLSTNEDKFVDKATIGQKNTNWITNMSNSDISVSSDGTTLSMTKTDSDIYYRADVVLTGNFEITYNAEFTNSNSIRALFKSTDTSKTLQFNHFTNGLWRITRTDGVFKFEVSTDNGETWTTKTNIEGTPTLTTEDCTFRFYQPVAETRIIKYSDFKMTHYSEYTSNTNSSGIASFSISDLSSSGKYTFEASYGSLTAECEVINALFYDDLTTDKSLFSYNNERLTVTYDSNGLHAVGITLSGSLDLNPSGNNVHPFDGTDGFIIDFDFKTANTSQLYVYDNTPTRRNIETISSSASFSVWKNHRWEYDADTGKLTPYIDNEAQTQVDLSTYNMNTFGFSIVDWQGDADFYLKNLVIYKP